MDGRHRIKVSIGEGWTFTKYDITLTTMGNRKGLLNKSFPITRYCPCDYPL